ncbi:MULTISPECIES: MFS transporter [Aeromonas]|uniref:MFS transporter n=2 Tax=Aeromonas TaxID=642 RepID=UPI0006717489|nr:MULTISPECIES: MFS transporter [Aeromonas]KMY27368.1 transcriptional regulator [Aeromonas caviae]MBL0511933.1 MFS transporter [Aeromonas media]MCR3940039.1 MFS transporter [Aeromonas caviae]QSO23955.1 MFS transporter [Aeromonas caviae]WED83327.1 MFS transporter [Aeromonas media]
MNATSLSSHTPAVVNEHWSAVAAMSLCVALLIAAEFMPVSLLTPIATDLGASNGMAGLAIAISGLFAVPTSLLIAPLSHRLDRRHVLMGLAVVMLTSLILIALSPNFTVLMVARALLGIVIGGFWALATATIMRLVGSQSVPKALGILYTGNAVATAFAAPIGSYLGGLIGWRGVFWLLVPLVVINLMWMALCLPSMRSQARPKSAFRLMRRPNVVIAIIGVTLTFAGAFSAFTYFRPFLETRTLVDLPQLSALLLALGLAGFAGTTAVSLLLHRHLYRMLRWLPLVLGVITLALLTVAHHFWGVALMLILWGTLNSAIPVAWSAWITQGIADTPESGGGLMVAAIQLSITLGAALGGWLLDSFSISATFMGSALLLTAASLVVGNGSRLRPVTLDQ